MAEGLQAARWATVRLWDNDAGLKNRDPHRGQGLLLNLDKEGTVVLTCHHVVAPVRAEALTIRILQDNGELGEPLRVIYDEQRSRPERDVAILRVDTAGLPVRPRPLLHTLNPEVYTGHLLATGLTYLQPNNFRAHVAPASPLEVSAPTSDKSAGGPGTYLLPVAYPLAGATDSRPGISGAVVMCEDGVLGLTHFSRSASSDTQREAYLVPLTAWAEGLEELDGLLQPLVDHNLRARATVRRVCDLQLGAGGQIGIAAYRPDVYIRRAVDDNARHALATEGTVIVVGKPKSGKSRLALELLKQHPEAIVVIPHAHDPPEEFEGAGLAGRSVILFFDDLHRAAATLQPHEWRRRLTLATGRPCQMVCTSRDGRDWQEVQANNEILLANLGSNAVVSTSRTGSQGHNFTHPEGRALAKALNMSSREFKKRFDGTPGSLLLDLADMKRRYERLRDERLRDERHGSASMARALDAAKLLYVANQPRLRLSLMRRVAETIRGDGRMSQEAWETLCRRTEEEAFGFFDVASDQFRTYLPYLEECIGYSPSEESLEQLVPVLSEAGDYDGLLYLGMARRGPVQDAVERTMRAAITSGKTNVWGDLCMFLASQAGRERDAEEAFRCAVAAGVPNAQANLGAFLLRQGQMEEAEQVLREAVSLGSSGATYNLCLLLASRPGTETEAETVCQQALAAGWVPAANALANVLARLPDPEAWKKAERLYRRAIAGGLAISHYNLAVLLTNQPGREAEAEMECRAAIEAGIMASMNELGIILARREHYDKAERAFRAAAAAGVPAASANLDRLLRRRQWLNGDICPVCRGLLGGSADANGMRRCGHCGAYLEGNTFR